MAVEFLLPEPGIHTSGAHTLYTLCLSPPPPEAVKAAGEDPADPQRAGVDGMAHAHPRSLIAGSVFYTGAPTSLAPAPGSATGARDPSAAQRSSQLLQPNVPSKGAGKRSPKLWPKRNALVAPVNGPAPPQGEWSMVTTDDFLQMHEEYGREVKELKADWLRSKQRVTSSAADLIDLG